MFILYPKSCELKKCKIVKHMELGLYRKPITKFQGSTSNGTNRAMYVKA